MAPYPSPQQQRHLPHRSRPAPQFHQHRQGHGNAKTDAVSPSLRQGIPADARGLRALVKELSAAAPALDAARAMHAHAAKLGLACERTVRNGLIALYLACGERAAARVLFDGFPGVRDVVSWTAMVTRHARLGLLDEAVEVFFAMADDRGVEFDAVAAGAGFAACAEVGDLALAREAHRRVAAARVALDVVVSTRSAVTVSAAASWSALRSSAWVRALLLE